MRAAVEQAKAECLADERRRTGQLEILLDRIVTICVELHPATLRLICCELFVREPVGRTDLAVPEALTSAAAESLSLPFRVLARVVSAKNAGLEERVAVHVASFSAKRPVYELIDPDVMSPEINAVLPAVLRRRPNVDVTIPFEATYDFEKLRTVDLRNAKALYVELVEVKRDLEESMYVARHISQIKEDVFSVRFARVPLHLFGSLEQWLSRQPHDVQIRLQLWKAWMWEQSAKVATLEQRVMHPYNPEIGMALAMTMG